MNTRRAWILGIILLVVGVGAAIYGQAIRDNPTAYDMNMSTPEMMNLVIQARRIQDFGMWTALVGGVLILLGFLFGGKTKSKLQEEAVVETKTIPTSPLKNQSEEFVNTRTIANEGKKRHSNKSRRIQSKPSTFSYSKNGLSLVILPDGIKVEESDGPSYIIEISEVNFVEIKDKPERIVINTFDDDKFEYEISEPQRRKAVEAVKYFVSEYEKKLEETDM